MTQDFNEQSDTLPRLCGACWLETNSPSRLDCPHRYDILSALVEFVGPVQPEPAKKATPRKTTAKKSPTKKTGTKKTLARKRPVKKHREELQLELFS